MDAANWVVEGDHAFVEFEGQQALRLQGARALLRDTEFTDGTIEFDLYAPDAWSFHYLTFRAVDDSNAEQFYIRPSQSGRDDAMQYTPLQNGLGAWQLYFGERFWGNATFAFDRWMHFRIEVRGQEMRAFIDSEEPRLVARLMRPRVSGGLALSSSFEAAHFANFSVEHAASAAASEAVSGDDEIPAGLIRQWEISEAFAEGELVDRVAASPRTWATVEAPETGIVNIAPHADFERGERDTVLLRTTLPRGSSSAEQITFGYSDRVVVFYNGRRIYAGDNGWRSRDFRYLGSVGLFDSIFVDTSEADVNELVFAVSETFGGWGLIARRSATAGVLP